MNTMDRSSDGGAAMAADVVVVGTGAAGFTAAVSARRAGASVVMLEAGARIGGTTSKSGAGYWTPNNHLLQARDHDDPRDDCLKHMAHLSYPGRFDPEAPRLGLSDREFAMLGNFYDNCAPIVKWLNDERYLTSIPLDMQTGPEGPPPWYVTPYDRAPRGRVLTVTACEGTVHANEPADSVTLRALMGGRQGSGEDMVQWLSRAAAREGVTVLLEHRVIDAVVDEAGAVAGVIVETPGGTIAVRAQRGVVFASGGFSHNRDLASRFLRGPIVGSPAVATARGDVVGIAERLGAQLGNMQEAWWGEGPFEMALEHPELPAFMRCIYGDSAVIVNAVGERVVNEKKLYNERTKVHFTRDADGGYPNWLLFAVFDQAVLDDERPWVGRWPFPNAGDEQPPWLIRAPTLEALAGALAERLGTLAEHTGGFRLDPGFPEQLRRTVERFNRFAQAGTDEDFHRGDTVTDREFSPPARPGAASNVMHPLAPEGPYYCFILGATPLDTKGGPVIDTEGRIVRPDGEPIPGLFGAGNCVDAGAGEAYWGGGTTLGLALTYGFLAGRAAARRDPTAAATTQRTH